MQPKKARLWSLLGYAVGLTAVQAIVIRSGLVPNENSIWLYNGFASLLFGSRLLNPYFTPPADAATNAFAALSSLAAAGLVVKQGTYEFSLLLISCGVCALILVAALAVIIARPPFGSSVPLWVAISDKIVRALGSPNIIFTVVIFVCIWLFHRDYPFEVFSIAAAVATIVILRPLEALADFLSWLREQLNPQLNPRAIGMVAAYQTPDIVLLRQSDITQFAKGTTALVAGTDGAWLLGIALNYVGRDEGNLLRLLTTHLPNQLRAIASPSPSTTPGAAFPLLVPQEQAANIPTLDWIGRLCGIVDSETTSDILRFEVIDEAGLSEGRLVEVRIGDIRSVLFQLIEGVTHEDVVQQKNKYGYARASAKKIGRWDDVAGKFEHVNWLPRINAPVFLKEDADFAPNQNFIGHFPRTSYGVSIDISQAVTHNTAILGILGIGKTYFTAELIERAIRAGVKVICLDLTNQYSALLAPFVDANLQAQLHQRLTQAGAGGVAHQNRELGGSRRAFKNEMEEQLRAFIAPANAQQLCIINPAHYLVTKQTSGMYQQNAELTTLTPSEIAAIVSDAALLVSQELGMTDTARLCLVYEEAHSLVPEWNSVASDGDKSATAMSARAILQGRKYGLGCFLITQRTANVTKTILNQCNTVVAMRTFDDTGKDFLANYIGASYAAVLPSLQSRHAVVFGKASSCENPVLLKLNERDDFLDVFRGPPVENNEG